MAVSSAQRKRDALSYTAKALIIASLVVYLGILALFALLDWFYGLSLFPASLLWSLAFAICSAIGAAIPAYLSYRNLLDPDYEKSSSVDRACRLTLSLPYHQAFQRCLDSLSIFGSVRILVADARQGRIEAALFVEPLWKLLYKIPSRISFRLASNQEGITKVEVRSRSPLPTVFIDFSGHKRNLQRIAAFLDESTISSTP